MDFSKKPGSPLPVRVTRADPEKHPDLDHIKSVVLKQGPRVRKEASYTVVRDRHTGERHHDAISITTYRKKAGRWGEDEKHSISLEGGAEDEIQKLWEFIAASRNSSAPLQSGNYLFLPTNGIKPSALKELAHRLTDKDAAELLLKMLRDAARRPDIFHALLEQAKRDPEFSAKAVAALNLAAYRKALDALRALVIGSAKEGEFQHLLTDNPWMFGSEYSEILPRRTWTRDRQQDFVLRRTTDGYIEVIEIKTPLRGEPLFRPDPSRNALYPGTHLSKALGQVTSYIEDMERQRDSIRAGDREDTNKIRAKIIIGRDGDQQQREALRNLNGHLHRIEVLTFDQLLRIGQRVMSYLEQAAGIIHEDDVPF